MNKYDKAHLRNLNRYQKQIDAFYQQIIQEAISVGASVSSVGEEIFSFDTHPELKRRVKALLNDYQQGVYGIIVNGIDAEWTLANNKNSELSRTVFGDNVGRLSQAQYRRYFSTNDTARKAFIDRKTAGLNLSDRVWRYTDQFKTEIELGLDVGIRGGQSAAEMARDLKQFLRYPDKLFRRVRDEHGDLQLSKAAAAFHSGQGVYRSSYKNARRLAATETNIAYRAADYERWQQLDFVVGIEIKLSGNHPEEDICDDLAGRYPKDFKFTGWHPHCRCHAETILKSEKEMEADTKKILNGEEPDGESVNRVSDVPKAFKDWVLDNEPRMVRSNQLPYFVTDNEGYVTGVLQAKQPSTRIAEKMMTEHFWDYTGKFKYASDEFDKLYDRLLNDTLTDSQKAIVVNQIKQECAKLTWQDLVANGQVKDDWVLARKEFNATIQERATHIVNGKAVKIDEVKMDILVFKDGAGREFVYPLGARKDLFKAVEASEVLQAFPPYLSRGVKQVRFLDTVCPADPYWKVKYNNPNHVSFATDGGRTTFWGNPSDKDKFKGTMAHEAAHIIDSQSKRFSNSKGWQEAVKKDDALYAQHLKGTHRVSPYALTNDQEDFAECVRVYICDHEYFKNAYPNRAAYIRSVAQKLSGHFKTP